VDSEQQTNVTFQRQASVASPPPPAEAEKPPEDPDPIFE